MSVHTINVQRLTTVGIHNAEMSIHRF